MTLRKLWYVRTYKGAVRVLRCQVQRSQFLAILYRRLFCTAPNLHNQQERKKHRVQLCPLLSSLSKILEKSIKNWFLNFFEKHKVFYEYQYGFRQKHSVIHALMDVTTLTYDQIQNKAYTSLLFMDLRKAFDTVSHEILLRKIHHYGIRGPAYDLIESSLTSRQQLVFIKNCQSSTNSINVGVPQGSVLGPLLFLIYVNDLQNATFCNLRLFTDDTCLVLSNPTKSELESNCNTELKNLHYWCNANKLLINPEKSTYILIPPKLKRSSL